MRLLLLALLSLAAADATADPLKLVFLGDSLTEGLGVPKDRAYPALVEKGLRAEGREVAVVNAGVSGSTSAGAAARMRWVLKGKPAVVVLALGANDGLRGLPVAEMKKNLAEALALAKARGAKVLLAGMKVPPNYGKEYGRRFEKAFEELAREEKVPLIPFLLEGVGGERSLNQGDQIHPNEKGHEKIAQTVLKALRGLL